MDKNNIIRVKGKVRFDPPDVTNKHKKQSKWKKVAILSIGSDLEKYYGWFIKKRYDISLSTTLRGPHVTFINDKFDNIKGSNRQEKENLWKTIKKKYEGKEFYIELEVSPRTDADYWWLRVYPESRDSLQGIRDELGLGKPYFGMHMTIGSPVDKHEDDIIESNVKRVKKLNVAQSKYIHGLIEKGLIK